MGLRRHQRRAPPREYRTRPAERGHGGKGTFIFSPRLDPNRHEKRTIVQHNKIISARRNEHWGAMATPSEKLAQSLKVLRILQDRGAGAIRAADPSRVHRERLVETEN